MRLRAVAILIRYMALMGLSMLCPTTSCTSRGRGNVRGGGGGGGGAEEGEGKKRGGGGEEEGREEEQE